MSGEVLRDEFSARLVAVAQATEEMLERLLSPHLLHGEKDRPSRLLEAMRYGSLGGGKRLRPFLLVETARAVRRAGRRGFARGLRAGDDPLLFADP